MPKRIIYTNEDGGVSIIIPAPECGLPIEAIARKDVPQGIPYKIIPTEDVPSDRTFRSAWEADISEPDGFGDPEAYWSEIEAAAAIAENTQLATTVREGGN